MRPLQPIVVFASLCTDNKPTWKGVSMSRKNREARILSEREKRRAAKENQEKHPGGKSRYATKKRDGDFTGWVSGKQTLNFSRPSHPIQGEGPMKLDARRAW